VSRSLLTVYHRAPDTLANGLRHGLGEVLRDAIIMTRMMEAEKEEGQEGVASNLGGEWSRERSREMCDLMDVEKNKKRVDQMRKQMEQGDEKQTTMNKVKEGFMKLKPKK